MEYIQDLLCGKMSSERSAATEERISESSLKSLQKSSSRQPRCLRLKKEDGTTPTVMWETDGALLTELSTRNIGECPSVAVESTLSQILEANVHGKYYLSAKACAGILRRAERRGKDLPEVLRLALERQASMDTTAVNDQGGNRIDITDDVTCTLRAEAHHPPCIMEETVALENHPADGRIKIETDGTMQTLTSRMGTDGNNVPLLLKIRSGCEGGGKGSLIQSDRSATLACNNDQTLFEPCSWDGGQISPTLTKQNAGGGQRMPDKDNFNCVLQPFGICSKDSNAMKSDNPHSGIYEAKTARTLDGNGGNPSCNQGGIAVVAFTQNQRDEVRDLGDHSAVVCANAGMKQQTFVQQGSMIGREDKNGPQGDGVNKDVSFTLNTVDRHAVVYYGIGRDAFNKGKNAKFAPTFEQELQPTLVAKGPGAIQRGYTVRRLTPTECARLQGFPDAWGVPEHKDDFTDEEYEFWLNVRNTYAAINGKAVRQYTRRQMLSWYNKLHTDGAEYKMWGNGIALPCALYVMQGVKGFYKLENNIKF